MSNSIESGATPSLSEAVKRNESFVHFDLNLSAEDKTALKDLKVIQAQTYDNFGAVDRLKPEAARFLEALGSSRDAAARGANIIERLVSDTLAAFGMESAWVTIRAALPNADYDIPRWHRDGTFYETPEGEQRKVAFVLKGASTLFNDMPGGLRQAFKEVARRHPQDSTESRLEIAKLVDPAQTRTADPGNGSVFVVGSDRAAIHSEPAIHTERLFVSVVPGTKAQIEDLRKFWNRPETTYAKSPASAQPAVAPRL